MKKSSLRYFPVILSWMAVMIIPAGCSNSEKPAAPKDPVDYKETLIKANKEVVRTESVQIDDFIRRVGWQMKATDTGIRYMIYEKGTGQKAGTGKTVRLDYTLSLITGDTVYTSSKDGPIEFEVGKGQVISGLEEAILLLRVGDRAKIIIPSHLAFGLIGDQNRINHKASLVYDIRFVSMN